MSFEDIINRSDVLLHDPEQRIYRDTIEGDGSTVPVKFISWDRENAAGYAREEERLIILPTHWNDDRPLLHGNALGADLVHEKVFGFPTLEEGDSKGVNHVLPASRWDGHYRVVAAGKGFATRSELVLGPKTKSLTYGIENPKELLNRIGERVGAIVNQEYYESLES